MGPAGVFAGNPPVQTSLSTPKNSPSLSFVARSLWQSWKLSSPIAATFAPADEILKNSERRSRFPAKYLKFFGPRRWLRFASKRTERLSFGHLSHFGCDSCVKLA